VIRAEEEVKVLVEEVGLGKMGRDIAGVTQLFLNRGVYFKAKTAYLISTKDRGAIWGSDT